MLSLQVLEVLYSIPLKNLKWISYSYLIPVATLDTLETLIMSPVRLYCRLHNVFQSSFLNSMNSRSVGTAWILSQHDYWLAWTVRIFNIKSCGGHRFEKCCFRSYQYSIMNRYRGKSSWKSNFSYRGAYTLWKQRNWFKEVTSMDKFVSPDIRVHKNCLFTIYLSPT